MGGVINTTKKAFGDTVSQAKTLFTHPSKLNIGQVLNLGAGGGLSPVQQAYNTASHPPSDTPTENSPFAFNPEQSAADQYAINAEGGKQYNQSLDAINNIGTAQTQRAKDLFGEMLPNIAENSQAAHLYDSTGYGQEVGRQQASIASQIADQEAQQRFQALGAKQGFQTGALQRGMSLEDFSNQAMVAKSLGAQMAPQAPSSKATGASGALSGAATGASFGPWGALAGGVAGGLLGSQATKKGK